MEEGRVIGKTESYTVQLKGIPVEKEARPRGGVSSINGEVPEGIRQQAGETQLGKDEKNQHDESLMSGGFLVQLVEPVIFVPYSRKGVARVWAVREFSVAYTLRVYLFPHPVRAVVVDLLYGEDVDRGPGPVLS